MKKVFVLFLCISVNSIFPQESNKVALFSSFDFGFYGGINFSTFPGIGGSLILEGRTTLYHNLKINFSLGYSRAYLIDTYNVKTYSVGELQGKKFFEAISYDVSKKGYDIFPLSVGFQFIFANDMFSPYVLCEVGYNFIGTIIYRSPGYTMFYNSFDEIPNDYKRIYKETHVNHSINLALGMGTIYQISPELNLDFRYLFKFDDKIINTHIMIVGISF